MWAKSMSQWRHVLWRRTRLRMHMRQRLQRRQLWRYLSVKKKTSPNRWIIYLSFIEIEVIICVTITIINIKITRIVTIISGTAAVSLPSPIPAPPSLSLSPSSSSSSSSSLSSSSLYVSIHILFKIERIVYWRYCFNRTKQVSSQSLQKWRLVYGNQWRRRLWMHVQRRI